MVEGNSPQPRLFFTLNDGTATSTYSVVPQPDGDFRVILAEGEQRSTLNSPGYTVKSFTYGSTNLLRDPLKVSSTQSGEFSVTLTPGPQTTGIMGGAIGGVLSAVPGQVIQFIPPPPPPSPSPPPLPPSATVIRVGSEVAAANLISQVKPDYPTAAAVAQISGVVLLSVGITKDGVVENITVISGHPLLTQPAIDAVKQWRYKPLILNSQPTAIVTTVTVSFP